MHILVFLFGILSFIAVWYWRLKVLREMTKDGRKLAETVSNLPRRLKFRRLTSQRGLKLVSDPREAATALMLEIAKARGGFSERQKAAVRAEIMQHFEFNEADADELIRQTDWLVGDLNPPERVVLKMTEFVQKSPALGPKQIVDLDGMLVAVSEAEGNPARAQMDLLTLYREKTGLRV